MFKLNARNADNGDPVRTLSLPLTLTPPPPLTSHLSPITLTLTVTPTPFPNPSPSPNTNLNPHQVACLELGKAYLDGVGCAVDAEQGRHWLQQVALVRVRVRVRIQIGQSRGATGCSRWRWLGLGLGLGFRLGRAGAPLAAAGGAARSTLPLPLPLPLPLIPTNNPGGAARRQCCHREAGGSQPRELIRRLPLGLGFVWMCSLDRKALLELETRVRRTGRETSDCNGIEGKVSAAFGPRSYRVTGCYFTAKLHVSSCSSEIHVSRYREASDGGGGERATPAASNNGWRYSYPHCYSYG